MSCLIYFSMTHRYGMRKTQKIKGVYYLYLISCFERTLDKIEYVNRKLAKNCSDDIFYNVNVASSKKNASCKINVLVNFLFQWRATCQLLKFCSYVICFDLRSYLWFNRMQWRQL